jgi:hypothetical protein
MELMRFVFALLAAGVISTAPATDKPATLTVDIKIDGQQSWKSWKEHGGDHGELKIAESFHVVLPLRSVGEPTNFNPLAPDYAEKQLAAAARVQGKVAQAQAQHGGPAVKRPKTQEEYMAMQKALADEMQKGQAACKNDMNCLMQLATQFSQKSAAILPPGRPAVDTSGDDDQEVEAPARFQAYMGDRSRPADYLARIDDRGQGAWNDVGGMVPWTELNTAEYRGNEIERKSTLYLTELQHDFVDGKFYIRAVPLPSVRGKRVYQDRLHGKEVNEDSEMIAVAEALDWAQAQLRSGLSASGTKSTVLKPARARGGVVTSGATFSGEIRVRVEWKLAAP